MTKLENTKERTKRLDRAEGVTKTDRTTVIILSQVVTIVALIVLWWILRNRQSST